MYFCKTLSLLIDKVHEVDSEYIRIDYNRADMTDGMGSSNYLKFSRFVLKKYKFETITMLHQYY